MGITQEISNNLSLDEFTPQERNQLSLLIEKFAFFFEEIRQKPTSIEKILDQRLLIRLGNYYYNQGDLSQAVEYYNLSILVKENEWAYFNSGMILKQEEKLELAYEKFDQSIKLKPDFPQAYRNQAEILFQQGDNEKALEKLIKSQQLNPNDPETNKLLADYYLEDGEKDEAIKYLKAIHHQDSEVIQKIEELERKESFLKRISNRIRNR